MSSTNLQNFDLVLNLLIEKNCGRDTDGVFHSKPLTAMERSICDVGGTQERRLRLTACTDRSVDKLTLSFDPIVSS